jgi:hypothetical protein
MSAETWFFVVLFSGLMALMVFLFALNMMVLAGERGSHVPRVSLTIGVAVFGLAIFVASLDPAGTTASVQAYLAPPTECINLNGKRYCEAQP